MKVVIDGIEYVPVSESIPSAEQITRGLLELFWGSSIPDDTTWQREANDLFIEVTDSPRSGVDDRVIDAVSAIVKRIADAPVNDRAHQQRR